MIPSMFLQILYDDQDDQPLEVVFGYLAQVSSFRVSYSRYKSESGFSWGFSAGTMFLF